MYTHKEILNAFEIACSQMYCRDYYIIQNNIHEQAFSHRIAIYLENALNNIKSLEREKLFVDCEYNRAPNDEENNICGYNQTIIFQSENSNISFKDKRFIIIRPDIIVHKRGTNKKNTIVIEIKNDNNQQPQNLPDSQKLKLLTSQSNLLKYKYGYELRYTNNEIILNEYKQGKSSQKFIYLRRNNKLQKIINRKS